MDWPTALVSIAASGAAATVAIWSVSSQTKNAREGRGHDLLVRRQERRHSAYLELLALLHRQLMAVERTAPSFLLGQPIEPPPPVSDEESWRLNAVADVIASDEVRTLLHAWTRKQSEFYTAVWMLRQVQQREGRPPSETKAAFGVTVFEQWRKVDELRDELWKQAQTIGASVRAEL